MAGNQAGEIYVKYKADLTEYEAAARRAGVIAEQSSKKIQDEGKKADAGWNRHPGAWNGPGINPDSPFARKMAEREAATDEYLKRFDAQLPPPPPTAPRAPSSDQSDPGRQQQSRAGLEALVGGALGGVAGVIAASIGRQIVRIIANAPRTIAETASDAYYSQRSADQEIENVQAGQRFNYRRSDKMDARRRFASQARNRANQLEQEINDNEQIARDAEQAVGPVGAFGIKLFEDAKNAVKEYRQSRNLRIVEKEQDEVDRYDAQQRRQERRQAIRTQNDVLSTEGAYGKYSIDDIVYNLQQNSADLNFLGSRLPRER